MTAAEALWHQLARTGDQAEEAAAAGRFAEHFAAGRKAFTLSFEAEDGTPLDLGAALSHPGRILVRLVDPPVPAIPWSPRDRANLFSLLEE